MPFIPESGRKAFLPRYHPQFAQRRAFQALTRPRPVTRSHGRSYCIFQTAAPGGKPEYHTHAAPTNPHSLKKCLKYRATRSLLFYIKGILSYAGKKCKSVFWFLHEKNGKTAVLSAGKGRGNIRCSQDTHMV